MHTPYAGCAYLKDNTVKRLIQRFDLTVERVTLRLFAAWLLLNFIMLNTLRDAKTVGFTSVKFAADINITHYILTVIALFLLLSVIDYFTKSFNCDAWVLLISVLGIAFTTVNKFANFYYAFFILIPVAAVLAWLIYTGKLTKPAFFSAENSCFKPVFREEKSRSAIVRTLTAFFLILIFGVFVFYVGTIGVLRYRTYSAPNFDFGIFVNMFHNMKETLLPTVSCERDTIMSHFDIHISPIWYLLLPFYALFPTPETLQIGQAVILASGVFPLYLICRKYSLSRPMCIGASFIYACLPALSSGTFYDIHENCFLTPLLLWTFYFFEKDKPIPMYIFAFLTLTVKEDAAVYVAIFALYAFFSRKKHLHGAIMIAFSIIYISVAVSTLDKTGYGAMTNRYSNYTDGKEGLIPILLTCIKNPAYIFTQFAVSGDGGATLASKLLYILQVIVPLGFVPFITKKISRYILLFPLILINLMPLYPYQYQIGFQYSFGSTAFLVYLLVINVADMKIEGKKLAVSFCAVASALLFTVSCMPTYKQYTETWDVNHKQFEAMDEILEQIDRDASVTASTMLLPHLADRSEIYEVHYHKIGTSDSVYTDYVVIDMRYSNGLSFYDEYMALDVYTVYKEYDDLITILIRKDLIEYRFTNADFSGIMLKTK